MSEEYFYHYTNSSSAKAIFLSGKILPSCRANGDAVHGDGVYLTTLDPSLGKETVGKNNWDGVVRHRGTMMECYFEILIPSCRVKRAKEKRDIQVFAGELYLDEYMWSLKNWEGDLLATQYFMIRSDGEAAEKQSDTMGRYTLCENIATTNDHPVYKHEQDDLYLYTAMDGNWIVGPIPGGHRAFLVQRSRHSPSPHKTISWKYYDPDYDASDSDSDTDPDNAWILDETLKVYPCY